MCETIKALSSWQRPMLGSIYFPLSLFQKGYYELTRGIWLDHQATSSWLLTSGHPDSLEVRAGIMSHVSGPKCTGLAGLMSPS